LQSGTIEGAVCLLNAIPEGRVGHRGGAKTTSVILDPSAAWVSQTPPPLPRPAPRVRVSTPRPSCRKKVEVSKSGGGRCFLAFGCA